MLYALYGAEFLHQSFKASGVLKLDDEITLEEAVVAIDVDRSHHDFLFLGYYRSDIVYDADIVVANDAQGDGILSVALAAPFSLYDAIAKASTKFGRIRAVATVNLDTSAHGDEAKYIIAIDWTTTFSQRIVDTHEVFVYHQHIVATLGKSFAWVFVFKLLSRAHLFW